MTLASIEGTIITAVIVVVMVVIRWLSERNAEKPSTESLSKKREHGGQPADVKRTSEEERMRRFMEALGIPADAAQSQPPAQPPPVRRPTVMPVPPIIVQEAPTRRWQTPVPPPMPRPARRQAAPEPVSRPFTTPQPALESAPAPTVPAGRIQLPELQTTAIEEFQTTSSTISAAPNEVVGLRELVVAPIEQEHVDRVRDRPLWQDALRSPEALRSAFVLREILGAPRGLQSVGAAHSFPSLQ